jgi:hypothetical protein
MTIAKEVRNIRNTVKDNILELQEIKEMVIDIGNRLSKLERGECDALP